MRLLLLLSLLSPALVLSWSPTPSSFIAAPQHHTTRCQPKTTTCYASTPNEFDESFEEKEFLLETPTFAEIANMQSRWVDEMQYEWLNDLKFFDTLKQMDAAEITQKVINAVVLIVSFGFALHTVLNIDHEITRGWTQQEIAMRVPLDNWAGYESALAAKPIATKTFINVVIYSLGDWLSQTVFQKKNVLDFDFKRTLRNGFIGLCFGPLVHQYYEWSDQILPVEGGMMNRLEKIFMDQTLYLTVKCSIYIAAVGILQGDSIKTAKETVQERILPICFTAWKFWPLIHCITYSVIPAQHRMLWVNCVDLVWNAILASMSRKEDAEELVAVSVAGSEDVELLVLKVVETASPMSHDLQLTDVEMASISNDLLLKEAEVSVDPTANVTEAVVV